MYTYDRDEIANRYEKAKTIYAAYGVDTDEAIAAFETIPISLHNWQGDDVVGFVQRHYIPYNAFIVIVGDIQAKALYELLNSKLGQWQPTGITPPTIIEPIEPLVENRRAVRTMDNKTQVDIALGWVGPTRKAGDFYAARVANVILGQLGLMGRLGQSVRDEQGLAYYSSSRLEGGLGPGPWNVRVGVSPTSVDQAIQAVIEQIALLCDEPVSDQELEDSQSFLTGILPLRLETNEGIADTIDDMAFFELGDDYIQRYPSIIQAITKQDIQAAARNYLHPDHYAVAIAGPYSED